MKTLLMGILMSSTLALTLGAVNTANAGQRGRGHGDARCYDDQRVQVLCEIHDGRHSVIDSVSAYVECNGYNGDRCYDIYVPGHRQGKMNVAFKCNANGKWQATRTSGESWCELYQGRRFHGDWW